MNPMNYRPNGIPVTNLSSQLWCEKQLEFSLEFGRIETGGMQKGKERHQDLHEEVADLVAVEPKSLEDNIGLRLHNCLVGLTRLRTEGMTRETPIWGKVNSLFTIGFIDEIKAVDGKLRLIDTKTRKSSSMPSEAQKRTTRFQLMLYRHLFNSINDGTFKTDDFLNFYGFNKDSGITEEFEKQITDLGDKIEPNIQKSANDVFSFIRKLQEIDDVFEVRYEYQETGEMIGVDEFNFDSYEFKRNCDFVEEFWLGKRGAMRVGENNKWKCKFCEFESTCWSNTKTLNQF